MKKRFIVINELKRKNEAIPFSNREQALDFYRKLHLKHIPKICGYEKDSEEYKNLKLVDENSGYLGLMICPEGKLGVWSNISTSNRDSICGKLPFTNKDKYIGNGDPNYYLTVGKPDGKPVPKINKHIERNIERR